MISHLGAMISVVNGALLAHRFKGITRSVGATSIGDGGTSTGAFHESLNQAAIEKLPLVLVVVNNQFAYSTPTDRQFACASLLDKAIGYGVPGWMVDGTDLRNCLQTIGEAVAKARHGGGPQMVVANLLRLCGHGEHDDASYVPTALKASAVGRDCLRSAEAELVSRGWGDPSIISSWRQETIEKVEAAVARVQREPGPDPYEEDWSTLASKHLVEGNQVDNRPAKR
jgi:pyruvate dehydrogenase E1 component alpha subunit/2-oxoisovalerate dehydrogenase E1 component alpha subunit